jgi:hypothetical protein
VEYAGISHARTCMHCSDCKLTQLPQVRFDVSTWTSQCLLSNATHSSFDKLLDKARHDSSVATLPNFHSNFSRSLASIPAHSWNRAIFGSLYQPNSDASLIAREDVLHKPKWAFEDDLLQATSLLVWNCWGFKLLQPLYLFYGSSTAQTWLGTVNSVACSRSDMWM